MATTRETYDWKRYWVPREGLFAFDSEGFLAPPGEEGTWGRWWKTDAALERMEALLNNREVKVRSFPAIANKGTGVLEAFNQLQQVLLNKFPGGDDAAAAAVVVR
jgi:hypothetical protein